MDDLKTKRALIIDDSINMREILKGLLERIGLENDEAEDGEEAIRLINKTEYDLLICDIYMPRLDGKRLVSILKKKNVQTPIIIMSANFTKENLMEFVGMNIKSFVAKPIDQKKLYLEIKKLLRESEGKEEVKTNNK